MNKNIYHGSYRWPSMTIVRGLLGLLSAVMVLFLSASVCSASATNIYIAQNSAGAANGADCADPLPVSFFNNAANWGSGSTQIGPGTTVHLCGTFTGTAGGGMLTAQGSGASGNPITILFEAGATLTSPYWSSNTGAINLGGANYIVVDGGTPCGFNPAIDSDEGTCNGTIENTANGDNLTYQQQTLGIYAETCNYCEVRNLTISNMYVHVQNGNFANQAATHCILFNGTNWKIHDNNFNNNGFCIMDQWLNDSNLWVYNNDLGYNEHDMAITGYGSGTGYILENVFLYANHMHDWANWDCPNDGCHHDGIHLYTGNGGYVENLYVYNNVCDGALGATFNTCFYPQGTGGPEWACGEPSSCTSSMYYFFNNVIVTNGTKTATQQYEGYGDLVFNNTVLCSDQNSGDIGFQVDAGSDSTIFGGFENNAEYGCGQFISFDAVTFTGTVSTQLNYNVYADGQNGGSGQWHWSNQGTVTSTWSAWQSGCNCDADSQYSTTGMLGLNPSYQPTSGSIVIGAGTNLTSLCSGNLAPLCMDAAGNPRPSTGAWDVGAYEYSSTVAPQSPTNLSAIVE